MPATPFIKIEAETKYVRDMMGRFRDTMPEKFKDVAKKATKIYAKEIKNMALREFQKPFSTGTLARSIKYVPINPEEGIYGVTAAKNIKGKVYAWYAELGRGPGKGVPFSTQFAHWAEAWYKTKAARAGKEYVPGKVVPWKHLSKIIAKYGTKRHPEGRFIKPGIKIAHQKIVNLIKRETERYITSKGRL